MSKNILKDIQESVTINNHALAGSNIKNIYGNYPDTLIFKKV